MSEEKEPKKATLEETFTFLTEQIQKISLSINENEREFVKQKTKEILDLLKQPSRSKQFIEKKMEDLGIFYNNLKFKISDKTSNLKKTVKEKQKERKERKYEKLKEELGK